MSETVLKANQAFPEIREAEPPESAIRDIRREVHTRDPAYDFYDELTDPLWSPPFLQAIHPSLDPESRLEDPPAPLPPFLSVWRWLWMALTGNT